MKRYVLRDDGLIAAFPIPEDHQIDNEVDKKIREKIKIEKELKARRIGGAYAAEIDKYIEECVAFGEKKKAEAQALREQFAIQFDDVEQAEDELMDLLKDDLIAYAELIGFKDVSGTKQEITDMILIAAQLKEV